MNTSEYIEYIQFKVVSDGPVTTYHSFYLENLDKDARLIKKETELIDDVIYQQFRGARLFFSAGWEHFKHYVSDSASALDQGEYDEVHNVDYDPVWLVNQFITNQVFFIPKPGENEATWPPIEVVLEGNQIKLPNIKDGIHYGSFTLNFKSKGPVTDLSENEIKQLGFNVL